MSDVVICEAPDVQVRLDVRLGQDTVWLTQAQMAELFGRERSVITKHINNVFREGELVKKSNVQNLHITLADKSTTPYSYFVIKDHPFSDDNKHRLLPVHALPATGRHGPPTQPAGPDRARLAHRRKRPGCQGADDSAHHQSAGGAQRTGKIDTRSGFAFKKSVTFALA